MSFMSFNIGDSTIDSRDVIRRLDELEDQAECGSDLNSDEVYELNMLRDLDSEARQYSPDWVYGEQLIHDSYWTDYVKDLLEDCGDIPSELPAYVVIDWDATAENIKVDYVSLEVGGETYWIRSS